MFCRQQRSTSAHAASADSTAGFAAYLLEVNCHPSLGMDSVYPIEGPHCACPEIPPADASWRAGWERALLQMPYKGVRPCKCRSHHRPHVHAPCAVDLAAKRATLAGALQIVRKDMAAATTGGATAAALCEGTSYDAVVAGGMCLC